MSGNCPPLTLNDIELFGRFSNEIIQVQADCGKLFEQCNITHQLGTHQLGTHQLGTHQLGGVSKDDVITKIITFCLYTLLFGASAGFFQSIFSPHTQLVILSYVQRQPVYALCDATSLSGRLSWGLTEAGSLFGLNNSCEENAVLFYGGIKKLQMMLGLVGVVGHAAIRDKVKDFVTSIRDRVSGTNPSGGGRKSRNIRKKTIKKRRNKKL
jgi:hypothetical protein